MIARFRSVEELLIAPGIAKVFFEIFLGIMARNPSPAQEFVKLPAREPC